jgi:outer membrane lipoprotein-sorting protein
MQTKLALAVMAALMLPLSSAVVHTEESSSETNVQKIVDTVDKLYRSESSYAEVQMEIVTPHWQRTLGMKVWTSDLDKTLIRIDSPKKEAGVTTLRIGSEMWNYLPRTDKVIKVPPSMMMSSWMGSDFTNDDLVKESSYLDDYNYRLASSPESDKELVYVELLAKEDSPTVWAKILLAVRRSDYIPVRQEFYDDRGDLMRVLSYREVREMGGRTIPAVLEMEPQTKEGHRTVIRYVNVEFDAGVPDNVFSLRNLRRHT